MSTSATETWFIGCSHVVIQQTFTKDHCVRSPAVLALAPASVLKRKTSSTVSQCGNRSISFVGRRSVPQVIAENVGKVAEAVVGWSWGRRLVDVFGVNSVTFSLCLLYVDGDSPWVPGRAGNNRLAPGSGPSPPKAQVGGL